MKKTLFLFIVLMVLNLSGCSEKKLSSDAVQMYFESLESFSATYDAKVDFGGVVTYSCGYIFENGKGIVSIIAPAELEGIQAVSDETGIKMQYEDVEIATYLPENEDYAPIGAMHGLIRDLGTKQPDSFSASKDKVELTFKDGDKVKKATLSSDGQYILSCEYYISSDLVMTMTVE